MRLSYYKLSFIFVLAIFILVGCGEQGSINPINNGNSTAEHYIVVLKTTNGIQSVDASKNEIQSFINSHNINQSALGHIYGSVVKGFSADLTAEQINQFSKDPQVAYIEKDQVMSIIIQPDVRIVNPKDNTLQSQYLPWGIARVGGPSSATSFSKAWIVDTGIYLTHSDLNVNTSLSRTFVRYGIDATTPNDYNGHGTHCSGIIAAKNNSFGVVGVSPNAQVIAVKVLYYNGSGYLSDIVAGLDYVYANASTGDVVNCSWGGGASTTIDNAISQFATRNAGSGPFVSVSIAAGNSYANANYYSPARVNGTGIYTVSAFGSGDVFAYFSNWANPPIDFSGPGINILSTYKNNQYAYMRYYFGKGSGRLSTECRSGYKRLCFERPGRYSRCYCT
jgi:subtilisin family serine protease